MDPSALVGFQLIAQEKLQNILCSIPGKKDLIIEPSLIKPLEHICAASWLKLKGIQRIFKLDAVHAITRSYSDQVHLYMIRSDLATFLRVLGQIKLTHESQLPTWPDDSSLKYFHIICVPSCFAYFQQLLEKDGLYGIVELHRYSWDFIHLDDGILSMEMSNVFSTAFMRYDYSLLPAIAHSLRVLQILCGQSELFLTYGEHSDNIVKMLNKLGPLPRKRDEDTESNFKAVLIIDRDKDFASPLLTPAIYSALLLEVFPHNAGVLDLQLESNKIQNQKLDLFLVPKPKSASNNANNNNNNNNSASSKNNNNTKCPVIRLNSQMDEIFAENRYRHFAAASSQIRQQANKIGMELKKLNNMKLDEMHDYVNRKLPKITELKTKLLRHLNASEKLIEMLGSNYRRVQTLEEDILNNVSRKQILKDIDELLTTEPQMYNTLRLLCLLHICTGITVEELQQFVRNYCNYFGLRYLSIFQQLAQAGLLPAMAPNSQNLDLAAGTTSTAATTMPLNKTASKLLSNISSTFVQTPFQANANRLKLMVSLSGAESETEAMNATSLSSSSAASNVKTSVATATNTLCPSYVFNRLYIPLIAQLAMFLLKSNNFDEFYTKLSMIDGIQVNGQSMKSYSQNIKSAATKDILLSKKTSILIFVVGGLTYAEIAACNLVGKLTESQIVVASDCILSGGDLIQGAF